MSILKAACVQMTSGPEIQDNLKAAEALIREAAGQGAQLIATPENTCHIRSPMTAKLESAPIDGTHPGVPFFADLAQELGIWLLAGSLCVKGGDGMVLNRSFLFSDSGTVAATYDKIHMFDAEPQAGEIYHESKTMKPGTEAVVAKTPFATLGLSICYDLRFSYLYRDMAKAGAQIMMVPSAFAVSTGKAHWETLLRTRAIETGSFVMAPAQTGEHQGGRKTWGHSLIIGPWGDILAEADDAPCVISADLDLEEVARIRKMLPSLQHDRDYDLTHV